MCRVAGDLLDSEVTVGDTCDLRQVSDRQHLRPLRQAAERLRHTMRSLAADARVDLVEHHRVAARDGSDRERDPRELAARGGIRNRPER
jgi:hypothetical protein